MATTTYTTTLFIWPHYGRSPHPNQWPLRLPSKVASVFGERRSHHPNQWRLRQTIDSIFSDFIVALTIQINGDYDIFQVRLTKD